MTDGTLLRGEVLARWQEFVGTGEFFRQIESTIARWRDKVTAAIKGNPPPADNLGEALQSGVAALLLSNAETAASETTRAWRRLPGGSQILAAHPDLAKPAPALRPDVERLVRDWQGEVLDLVRTEGQGRRTNARIAAYGLNAIGLFLMLVAFSSTAGLTGAEIGIAGGTALLAQRVLEAIFGDQAVREMAAKARHSLLERADGLYAAERERYAAALAEVAPPADQAQRLDGRGGRAAGGGAVSPLRMGSSRGAVVSAEQLAAAATALASAVEAGGEQLPAAERQRADAVVAKVTERTALVGGHTVVALAGATGSGKSSLFNALVGTPVATVGRAPAHDVDPDRRDLGRRAGRRPARLARRRRPAPGGERPGSRRPAAVGAAARSAPSTGWCCSTCPTSTPARSATAPRPSGCSSSSTCSCGSPTRRSTPTHGCTTTTSRR